jgi:hypothetical protein
MNSRSKRRPKDRNFSARARITMRSSARAFADTEFSAVDFGDRRLDQRFRTVVAACVRRPGASFPEACGDDAELHGAYDFMAHDRSTPNAMLNAHRERTLLRCCEGKEVLFIADTTVLDRMGRTSIEDEVGPTSHGFTRGQFLQVVLAATPDGTPLGVLDALVWTRSKEVGVETKLRHSKPTVDKESCKWVRAVKIARTAKIMLGDGAPVVTLIFDREGDVFAAITEAIDAAPHVWLLVRVQHDRGIEDVESSRLFEHLESLPVAGRMTIDVPRSTKRRARTAELALSFGTATLSVPTKHPKAEGDPEPAKVYVVRAEEVSPPKAGDAIRWQLLTTRPVENIEDARRTVERYSRRWLIEQFFRALKTDCKHESRQFRSVERLQKALTLDAIVAWRLLYLTTVARERPDLPCDHVFGKEEWRALWLIARRKPPRETPTLIEAALVLGGLGGYRARDDCPPGATVISRGLRRLDEMMEAARIMRSTDVPTPRSTSRKLKGRV